jgi:hypothetical protein
MLMHKQLPFGMQNESEFVRRIEEDDFERKESEMQDIQSS